MKKLIAILLVLVMSVGLMYGCGAKEEPAAEAPAAEAPAAQAPAAATEGGIEFPELKLQLGHANPTTDEDQFHFLATRFAQYINEASGGKIEVTIYGDSQLGGERDMLEGLQLGTLELMVTGNNAVSTHNPSSAILDLPYMFLNRDEVVAFYNSDIMDIINADVQENVGVVPLAYAECGFRHVLNNTKPIESMADLKGMKLRVVESDVYISTFDALGANPTPMAFAEAFTGLQQGTIDGMELPIATINSKRAYEMADYLTLTNHLYTALDLLVSESVWEKLSPEVQAVFYECAQKAADEQIAYCAELEANLLSVFEEAGMAVVTDMDLTEFQTACVPIQESYRDSIGAEVYDATVTFLEGLR